MGTTPGFTAHLYSSRDEQNVASMCMGVLMTIPAVSFSNPFLR